VTSPGPRPPDGETGVGDIVRALAALRLGPNATALVARMAGFRLVAPAEPAAPAEALPQARPRPEPPPETAPTTPLQADQRQPTATRAVWTLTAVAREERVPAGNDVDPFPVVQAWQLVPSLPYLPLLRKEVARDVLDSAAAVRRPGTEVDLDHLLADLVAGRPIERLPRRPVLSLEAGLEVLIDVGEGMQPFRRDVREVLDALHRLIGPGLSRRNFYETPWTEGWRPRDQERPVLVLGTLGCGELPDLQAVYGWVRLITALRKRGTRLTALVPVPPWRWHPALRLTGTLVPWDRTTRYRDVPRS
jgi:hypothetical protein